MVVDMVDVCVKCCLSTSRSFRRRQERLLQKYNFKASWMNRGLTDVFEICPNVLVANVVSGALNCGVLSRLRNSARNSIRLLSPEPSGIFLITDISKLCWPGPVTMPTPLFPKAAALPSLPITGGVVRQAVLKYLFSRS